MAALASTQVDKVKINQIVSEFFAKSLHIVLESRIPSISVQNQPDAASHYSVPSSSTSQSSRSSNRWFNLEMDNCVPVNESAEPWRRGSMEPMVIDILFQQPIVGGEISSSPYVLPRFLKGISPCIGNSSGDSWSGDGEGCASPRGLSRILLERWIVQYVPMQKGSVAVVGFGASKPLTGFGEGSFGGGSGTPNIKGVGKGCGGSGPPLPYPSSRVVDKTSMVYQRTVIMLRSLYCTMRTLPSHRLCHPVNPSSHSRSSFSYRVYSAPPSLSDIDEAAMMTLSLTPVETMWGRICVSVAYRNATAVTALEIIPPIVPKIFPDYVGSPTTDPLRRFPNVGLMTGGLSGRGGVHVVTLPSSVPSSPSGPSRTSGSPSPSHPLDFNPSPPMGRLSPHSSSSSTNLPLGMSPRTSPSHPSLPRRYTSQPVTIHGRGHSPSLSPSPSPSPPASSHVNSHEDVLSRGPRSAPVNIPKPSSAKPNQGASPRRLLGDVSPNRNVDIVPRPVSADYRLSTIQVPNLFMASLHGRVASGLSISSLAESTLVITPPHPYYPPQVAGDKKGQEGPPSGMKMSLYGPRRLLLPWLRGQSKAGSQNDVEEEVSCLFAVEDDETKVYQSRIESPKVKETSDASDQAHRQSHDAAVGALVRMLRSAPPLGHGSSVMPINSGPPLPRPAVPSTIGGHPGFFGSGKLRSSPPGPSSLSGNTSLVGSPRSQLVQGKIPRKTSASALEELRGYIKERDQLMRQSGRKLQSSAPTKNVRHSGK